MYPEVPDSELDVVKIFYKTFNTKSQELIRMSKKPSKVAVNNMEIKEINDMGQEGWSWQPLENGGLIKVRYDSGNTIMIYVE